MNVRCPGCGGAVALAVGDTRLACAACGLAAPVSRLGTEPGGTTTGAVLVALETDLTGSTLAGRTIVERIGAGGMGTVYRARGDGGEVAIKVLRPALGVDRSTALARFAREAEALRRLDHSRVVRLLEHGEDAGVAYIVTELVRGRDLAATLAAGQLSFARIIDIFAQVCDGVAAAHASGIVHRDLKPANILVGEDGMVKIADFGLAQLGPEAAVTTLTRTDVAMGTFHYLAPEQRKDAHGIDHRADVWALGVILYEMLTGELPLGSFAPPSAKRPDDCGRRADTVIRRALAPDRADRFATVAELGEAARSLAPRTASRRRFLLAAAAVLVIGTGGAVAMTQVGDDDRTSVAAVESDAPLVAEATLDAARFEPAVDASVGSPTDVARVTLPADAGTTAKPEAVFFAEGSAAPPKRKPVTKPTAGSGSGAGSVAPRPPTKRRIEPTPAGSGSGAGSAPPRPTKRKVVETGSGAGSAEPPPPTKRKAVEGGKVSKPVARGKVSKTVDDDEVSKPVAVSKVVEPPVPAVCQTARRCCFAVMGKNGSNCNAHLKSDEASCEAALAELRGLATNPKQRDVCK